MIQTVKPGQRSGAVTAPVSKSAAHRQLIAAALSNRKTELIMDVVSDDIRATIDCLNALGAEIRTESGSVLVNPISASD